MASTIEIGELRYDLLDPDDLSFGDQRKLKRYCGGMPLAQILDGLNRTLDPDAWFGLILLSVQVKNPTFSEGDLEKLNMVEITNSLEGDPAEVEVADDPPAVAPAAEVEAPAPTLDRSPSESASAETPVMPGVPA